MQTLPPAGIPPTMPPPPRRQAQRSLRLTGTGLGLLVVAIVLASQLEPNESRVFTGRNDFEVGSAMTRVLFGASGAATLLGVGTAWANRGRARGGSAGALLVALLWLITVVAWTLRGR